MSIIDRFNLTTEARLEHWEYPVTPIIANDLVELLRTEWTRSDFDWLEAMYGDYGRDLTIKSVIARHHGQAVATASVLFSRRNPEVALLGNVLTRRNFRSRGIGGRVVEEAVFLAEQAGCRACFLGTQAAEHNVYQRHGFRRYRGVVMRRSLDETEALEMDYFRPSQPTMIRTAHWGDLPGVTLLTIQPLQTFLLDYLRGLVSGRCDKLERCVSNFPLLMESLRICGGTMLVLAEPQMHRVFGFGTVTIGAGIARRHSAMIDVAVHDHFGGQTSALLKRLLGYCREKEIRNVQVCAAAVDTLKIRCLEEAGFSSLSLLRSALVVNDRPGDVLLMEQELSKSRSQDGQQVTQLIFDGPQTSVQSSHDVDHLHTDSLSRD